MQSGTPSTWVDSTVESTRSANLNRQPPNFPGITEGGQQVLGLGITPIDFQHLPRCRCRPLVATVDRRHRLIQQLIDRRAPLRASAAVIRAAITTVAHVNIVSPPVK
jgi:hypothetical protein